MLEIERKRCVFKTREIWFNPYPFEVTDSDNVTFYACKNKVDIAGFRRAEFNTLVIDLTRDIEEIWEDMHESSCRYAIKRAERDGVKIKVGQGFEDFVRISRRFRRAKGLARENDGVDFYKKYGVLFTAESNGETLAGQFYLKDEDNMRWLIGTSKRLEASREKATLIGNANRLLVWEAIKYAKDKGIKEFDMGGYYLGNVKNEEKERINFFKRSFGGKPTTNYIYQKNYSKIYGFVKNVYNFTGALLKR